MRIHLLLTALPLLVPAPGAAAEPAGRHWTPELALRVKRVTDVRVAPDGRRAAFVVGSAVTEDEKSEWLSHIHVGAVDGGGAFVLTAGEKSATSPAWSPDGKWIAFVSERGPGEKPKANVWRIRVGGGEAEQLTDEKGGISAIQWSPDGRSIAFVMADPPSADEEKAGEEKRDVRVVDEDWKILRLYVVPVEKGPDGKRPVRKLTSGAASVGNAGGPARFDWSPDGASIVFAHQPSPLINDWVRADVAVVDVATGAVRPLAATAASENDPVFSHDGRWVAYAVSEDDPPRWNQRSRVAVVAASGGAPRLLAGTHDGQPEIRGWLADGRVLVSENWRTVERLAALPADGGPAAYITPEDVMVSGAALNDAGTHDYRDIMSGVDALVSKGVADPDRMGIMGWSYGGFMTSWVITQTQRFKAASVGAGVTNIVSFTGTADIPGFIPDYFGGEFWEGGLDRWRAHSAMFHVQNVKTPTLIQHGEADLRVPVSQGYELYNALRRRKVPVQMVVYPRQPHGLREPKFIADAMRRNLDWFDRWVLGREPVSS